MTHLLFQVFISHVVPTFIDPDRYCEREINVYVKLCVEITWFMSIQDPPMVFIDKIDRGAEFDTDFFRKYKNNNGHKFDYLVWPALLLFERGPLVVKGVAQPIKKKHAIYDVQQPQSDEPHRKLKMPDSNIAYVEQSPRDPEAWVDLEMESDDDNSWERDSPHTPPQVYRQDPVRDDRIDPLSPYFHSPEQNTGIPVINVIEPSDDSYDHTEKARTPRRSPKGSTPYHMNKMGNDLTVQWKKGRMPSAP